MNVLVTGAGGFVGRRLVPLLAARGNRVTALVHRPLTPAAARLFEHPAIETRVVDLERSDTAFAAGATDAVVALAQSQHFREFPQRAEQIFAVNVSALLRLLEWARASGVRRFVYASSGGIYGPRARFDVAEGEPLAVDSPLGFYLGSKLCAEVLFQNYREFFECAVILRPFFIYGPGQRSDMLLPRLVHAVREGRAIQLQGRDGLKMNPIYVDDAAEAFAAALGLAGARLINLAGPETASLRQISAKIGRALGREPRFERVPGTPSDYVANIDTARALLGAPKVALDAGIARTVADSSSA